MNWRKELESFDLQFDHTATFTRENKNVLIWGNVYLINGEEVYSGDDRIGTTYEYEFVIQEALVLSEEDYTDYSGEVQEILNTEFNNKEL